MSKEVYLSPKGRAGFTALDKAKSYKDKATGKLSDPRYTATVIVPREEAEDLINQLQPVLDAFYADVSKKDKTIKKLPVFPAEVSKSTGEETGNVIIKANSKFAVQVMDGKKNVIKNVPIGPGSIYQMVFSVKPTQIKKDVFLTCYLASVKVSQVSEGGADYSNMFEADEGDDTYVYGADQETEGSDDGENLADAVNI